MLQAGAAQTDISPLMPMFLVGYPHVERTSTATNDPLLASALCLKNGSAALLLIALDLLFIDPPTARELRDVLSKRTDIPADAIMITCSHTHSGPVTIDMLSFRHDPVVPKVDPKYLAFLKEKVLEAAFGAVDNLQNAELATTTAMVEGAGCNRHDPEGPRDREIGIVVIRNADTGKVFALSATYAMHPTVLHEDSTLISSDFPAYARLHLQENLAADLITLYHTGPSGNQSPRYHVKGQTLAETERIGRLVGAAIYDQAIKLTDNDFSNDAILAAATSTVTLPPRTFPTVTIAEAKLREARETYDRLKAANAGHGPLRTAECALFGAEETLVMAHYSQTGELQAKQAAYNPVEIQVLRIGDTYLAGFPGEVFVEYGLELKAHFPVQVIPVSLVNGELQGYVVTPDATGYEADNSMFSPQAGIIMVEAIEALIHRLIKQ